MAVDPTLPRAGIGKKLVQTLERQARSEDDRYSKFLESAEFNASELKIYVEHV
ncbi:MAG: GNAT family N-acetyltransferase [Dehalococcoidia bacterium]|nr:GNAT family N-acetyltransferase [Dehalococcoidia bacterium]